MLLAHKVELRPSKEQAERLFQWVGTYRHCYNNSLAYFSQEDIKYSKKEARKYLQEVLRVENEWYLNLSQDVLRESLNDLDNAYTRFFKKLGGFPKFKKRGMKDNFSIRDKMKFSVKGKHLRIKKFNKGKKDKPLLLRENLRFEGVPKQVTISYKAGKWFASILVDVTDGYSKKYPEDNTSVGIDLGVKELVTTSNGETYGKSNKLGKKLKKLEKLQQKMARQVKGSNRQAITKQKIQKLHFYVSEQRKQMLHQVSDDLTSKYQTICIEDLDVKAMLGKSNKNLSRCIADVGMGMFKTQLEYKAFLRGGGVVKVDQYFPSSKMCSGCGCIKENLKLLDREYNCDCGLSLDRDLNAAINILTEGLKSL